MIFSQRELHCDVNKGIRGHHGNGTQHFPIEENTDFSSSKMIVGVTSVLLALGLTCLSLWDFDQLFHRNDGNIFTTSVCRLFIAPTVKVF